MALSRVNISTGPEIAYEDTGGAGVPIIFSHGLFMNHAMFAPQIQEFSDHGAASRGMSGLTAEPPIPAVISPPGMRRAICSR